MNVEDSYEGAVRRLRRLGHAGVDLAPPKPAYSSPNDRLRDLEELATLACDENEQLKSELAAARGEIARLHRVVATLQESMIAGSQADDPFTADKVPRKRGAFYFFLIVILGGGAAALYVTRPWEHARSLFAIAATPSEPVTASPSAPPPTPTAPVVTAPAPTTPTAPVVTAPAPTTPTPAVAAPAPTTPKVEPTIPKAAPTIPKAAPTIPKAEPTVPKIAAPEPRAHHSSKHHASKGSRHEKRGASDRSSPPKDDPLGGLNL
jgi:hypothetical protein